MRAPERDSNKNWRTEHHGHIGIVIHSNAILDAELRTTILDRVRRSLEAAAKGRADHVTVEIRQTDAPRRTPNVDCRIDVHAWHAGPMTTVEVRGKDPEEAAMRALKQLTPALHRAVRDLVGAEEEPRDVDLQDNEPVVIGRREGRAQRNVNRAVNGADEVARERRGQPRSTARRNAHADTAGMTSALEDSAGRPSRKSTRRATNRIKSATQLTRRTKRNVRAPQTRAQRQSTS